MMVVPRGSDVMKSGLYTLAESFPEGTGPNATAALGRWNGMYSMYAPRTVRPNGRTLQDRRISAYSRQRAWGCYLSEP
jgi:hypothetical protein